MGTARLFEKEPPHFGVPKRNGSTGLRYFTHSLREFEQLYDEMLRRLKETDGDVPYKQGSHCDYRRKETGEQQASDLEDEYEPASPW